jgi:hypothetical protein
LTSGLLPSIFLPKFFMYFLSLPHVPLAPPISSSLIWSSYPYLMKSTNYEAPHYVFVSNLLLLICVKLIYFPRPRVFKYRQPVFLFLFYLFIYLLVQLYKGLWPIPPGLRYTSSVPGIPNLFHFAAHLIVDNIFAAHIFVTYCHKI